MEPVEYAAVLVRTIFAISFLCLVGIVTWALHSLLPEEDNGFLQWRDPAVTAAGRALYTSHCASCHGMPDEAAPAITAPGKAPPLHGAAGHTWQHPDFALFRLVQDGVAVANCVPVDPKRMPKFSGTVGDPELVAILSYIKSTWPDDVRRIHDQVNRMYRPYNEAIGSLVRHGSDGRL